MRGGVVGEKLFGRGNGGGYVSDGDEKLRGGVSGRTRGRPDNHGMPSETRVDRVSTAAIGQNAKSRRGTIRVFLYPR